MDPNQLQPDAFLTYPPEARQIVTAHIVLLRKLPLSFLPLLLREVIAYDWKFPAERKEIDHQFAYLERLSADELRECMGSFVQLHLSRELEQSDWVNAPGP